ncbi:sugar kinase [Vagococcus silagei]|uniref:Sugar kinase n=1 Tax=Vagococcus silagei TaxID=2508885 RepID=A0A4S3B894_9ENTE|nr:sugar kinase [Vagococcus silagei]THB62350.1 sugar kinase [Vagococcus silagei]
MAKVITLGEILIRYATEPGVRLANTASLALHYGGSEANVCITLSGLGHDSHILSKLPDNPLGHGALQHLRQYGVQTDQVLLGGERFGAYFVEMGAGPRPTSVVYDRKYSSFASMKTVDWKLAHLFDDAEIFHVSGITPALSEEMAEITLQLVRLAKEQGLKVSFDSNYRAKLWSLEEASAMYERLLPYVDYCSMGKLDALNILGVPEYQNKEATIAEELDYYYSEMHHMYPNIKLFYATMRDVISTNENNLTGTIWSHHELYFSKEYKIPAIVDRIGGGDAFTAGILHGLLTNLPAQETIEFATGLSTLKHTISGDSIYVTPAEVTQFCAMDSSKINR